MIKVTLLVPVLTDEAIDRVDSFSKKPYDEDVDWEAMGIEKETEEDDFLTIDIDDYKYIESTGYINPSQVSYAYRYEKEDCTMVVMNNRDTIRIKNSVDIFGSLK